MFVASDPIVALTSGEPAGVGLELSLAAWQELRFSQPFFIIADRNHLAARIGSHHFVEIASPRECRDAFTRNLPLLHQSFPEDAKPGYVRPENAPGVVRSIQTAARLATQGDVAAICTNPITKSVFRHAAGKDFSGHTEFLADLCDVPLTAMMLTCEDFRVVPVTGHMSLAEVPQALTLARLRAVIEICIDALKNDFGVSDPVINLAGLNPHAGEGGLFGTEEQTIMIPVIEEFNAKGITLQGPFSADTLFRDEMRERCDLILCMYHDQALIPIKTLFFHETVNVTLGLPIIRTSPDHGTALDIAGQFVANASSLTEAIRLAGQLARSRYGNV